MKRILALLLALSCCFGLMACGKNDTPVTNGTDSTADTSNTETSSSADIPPTETVGTPLSHTTASKEWRDKFKGFDTIIEHYGTPWGVNKKLDIPVYYEDELFGSYMPHGFRFGMNHSWFNSYRGECGQGGRSLFSSFPTNALRVRDDKSSYAVYDTDTGYRVYMYISGRGVNLPYQSVGYFMIIDKNKMLCRDDFKNIEKGDSIREVEVIDRVATLYKTRLEFEELDAVNFERSATLSWNATGQKTPAHTVTASFHYLKDGILRIDYLKRDDGKTVRIVVSNMTFYEDFMIEEADGSIVNYKIKDIDLPVS